MATLKQKMAFKKIAENHGNVSKTMLQVGYDPDTAKKPSNLTNSKGWKGLVERYLSDTKLAKVHNEGLKATTLYGKDAIEHPDYGVRHRYLETAYKLKGKLNQASEGNKTLVLVVSGETASRYENAVKVQDETAQNGLTKPKYEDN